MVGRYEIEITNNRVTFFLEIKRNITIIQGDSATGKTTLIRMLSEYNRLGMSSGVTVKCQKECVALVDSDWKHFINNSRDRIIFLDENNQFIRTKEFAEAVCVRGKIRADQFDMFADKLLDLSNGKVRLPGQARQ